MVNDKYVQPRIDVKGMLPDQFLFNDRLQQSRDFLHMLHVIESHNSAETEVGW